MIIFLTLISIFTFLIYNFLKIKLDKNNLLDKMLDKMREKQDKFLYLL